jgi:hypothetical protein
METQRSEKGTTKEEQVIFTKEDIPDYHTLVAVNCFYADYPCDERLSKKCRAINPDMWRKCPKQTNKIYSKEK